MLHYRLEKLMRQWEHEHGEEHGELTYRRLGELTGIGYPNLQRMATGKTSRADHNTIETICKFFECKVEELIEFIP